MVRYTDVSSKIIEIKISQKKYDFNSTFIRRNKSFRKGVKCKVRTEKWTKDKQRIE